MLGVILLIFGVLFIATAIFGYYIDKKKSNNVLAIRAKTLSTVAEIFENYEMLGNAKIERQFYKMAEIEGEVSDKNTLSSPLSTKKCIFYDAEIYRILEDKSTNTREKEKVWSEKKHIDFYLKDHTGEIGIRVNDNDLKTDIAKLAQISTEGFLEEIPQNINIIPASDTYKLIGYEVKETTLLSQTPMYVYGEVNDRDTELMIAPPHQEGKMMFVSNLPKQYFIKELRKDIQMGKIIMPIFIILGGLLIWWGGSMLKWF